MKKEFTCKYCHTAFQREVFPKDAKKSTFEFCSPVCRNKSRSLEKLSCPICGQLFTPRINDIVNGKKVRKRFCSAKCGNKSRIGSKSTNPKTHTQKERDFVKENYPTMGADWLSEKMGYSKKAIACLAHKIGVTLNKDVYRKKVHDAAKEYMTGSRNPNWQGGETYKELGSNWGTQRKAAIKRDGYACQVCFVVSRKNHIHHIIPRRFYDGHVEDANVLENLITLCPKHHKLVECGKIKLPSK